MCNHRQGHIFLLPLSNRMGIEYRRQTTRTILTWKSKISMHPRRPVRVVWVVQSENILLGFFLRGHDDHGCCCNHRAVYPCDIAHISCTKCSEKHLLNCRAVVVCYDDVATDSIIDFITKHNLVHILWDISLIARIMRPSWGPTGAARTQVDPTWIKGTQLSGIVNTGAQRPLT